MKTVSLIFLFALLLATNRWLNFADGISFLKASDTQSYMALAKSVSGSALTVMPYHHAQRFALPYFIGALSQICGISVFAGFVGTTLALCLGIILITDRILRSLHVTGFNHTLCIFLLIFNPYAFRYYLAVPAMATDLLLVFGISLCLLGLIQKQVFYLLMGLVLATLGRQTAVLLLPGIILWIFYGQKWRIETTTKKVALGILLTMTLLSTYFFTAKVGQQIAGPGHNLNYFFGMYYWMRTSFNLRMLLELLFRAATPLFLFVILMTGGLFFRFRKKVTAVIRENTEIPLCIFLVLSMLAQPILGDPEVFIGNMTRYSAQTFIFALVTFALLIKGLKPFSKDGLVKKNILLALIFLASFHHMYTNVGGSSKGEIASGHTLTFIIFYSILAIICGFLMMTDGRHLFNIRTSPR